MFALYISPAVILRASLVYEDAAAATECCWASVWLGCLSGLHCRSRERQQKQWAADDRTRLQAGLFSLSGGRTIRNIWISIKLKTGSPQRRSKLHTYTRRGRMEESKSDFPTDAWHDCMRAYCVFLASSSPDVSFIYGHVLTLTASFHAFFVFPLLPTCSCVCHPIEKGVWTL